MHHYATDVPMVATEPEELKNDSLEALIELKRKYKTYYPEMQIETVFSDAQEAIANEISDIAQTEKADLIIMGTSGASGMKEELFGTTATASIEKAPCPVLLIPEKTNLLKIEKIVFATDYQDNDLESLGFLCKIGALYNAEIIIVHISQTAHTDEYEPDLLEWFRHELKEKQHVEYKNISFHLLIAGDVVDELQAYIEKYKVDIVAMSTRKRNTFSRLFNKSFTKTFAYHTHIPLLAFHGVKSVKDELMIESI